MDSVKNNFDKKIYKDFFRIIYSLMNNSKFIEIKDILQDIIFFNNIKNNVCIDIKKYNNFYEWLKKNDYINIIDVLKKIDISSFDKDNIYNDILIEIFNKINKEKKEVKFCAVVKSNAYGHGLVKVSHGIEDIVDCFAVAICNEGVKLRRNGIKKDIIILGSFEKYHLYDIIKYNLIPTVCSLSDIKQIFFYVKTYCVPCFNDCNKIDFKNNSQCFLNKKISIELKINTGMNRIGISLSECIDIRKELDKLKDFIDIHGIFTHFSSPKDKFFTHKQNYVFERACEIFEDFKPIKHVVASNSLCYNRYYHDMVRCGIAMYGYLDNDFSDLYQIKTIYKSMFFINTKHKYRVLKSNNDNIIKLFFKREFYKNHDKNINRQYSIQYIKSMLKPAMHLQSNILKINHVKSGEHIGYGNTIVDNNCTVATVRGGYGDGLLREVYRSVEISGKVYNIIGSICMDMFVVLLSCDNKTMKDNLIIIGDKIYDSRFNEIKKVTIIGDKINANNIAINAKTIPYQVLTAINPRDY